MLRNSLRLRPGARWLLCAWPAFAVAFALLPASAGGQGWATEATLAPAGASDSQLGAVSCAGAAACMAVGEQDAG